VHHGVRVHSDIFRGQGASATGHPETADETEGTKERGGCKVRERRRVVDDGAEPVGRVADDQFHYAAATAGGHRDGDERGGTVTRIPVAAGYAGEHHVAGDRLRLRERREHERREQGR